MALATLAAAAFAHETDLDSLRQRKASHVAAPAELAVALQGKHGYSAEQICISSGTRITYTYNSSAPANREQEEWKSIIRQAGNSGLTTLRRYDNMANIKFTR